MIRYNNPDLMKTAILTSLALLAASCLVGAGPSRFVQDRFVIGMWVPPATNEKLDARYREIAEANFTLVVGQSGTNAAEHLKRCKRFGLQTLIGANGPVEKLPDGPACWGYLLVDEPGAGAFADLGKRAEEIRTKRPGRFGYVNLYPNYAPLGALGTSSYDEHVAKFVREVKPEVLVHGPLPADAPRGRLARGLLRQPRMLPQTCFGRRHPVLELLLQHALQRPPRPDRGANPLADLHLRRLWRQRRALLLLLDAGQRARRARASSPKAAPS